MTDKRCATRSHMAVSDNVAFMKSMEERFKAATGLQSRSFYKLFYGQVRAAPILTLGINPGGAPADVSADGRTGSRGVIAAASSGYYEGDECDVLDCDWRENASLRPLLAALLGGAKAKIRTQVVKTNMAFRRSARKNDIDIDSAIAEAAPFLAEIIQRVNPHLVLLTGVALNTFINRYASATTIVAPTVQDPKINHVVFAGARATLLGARREALVAQVAHASQFGWTYDRYEIPQRILQIMERLS